MTIAIIADSFKNCICIVDVDECAVNHGGCSANADCIDTPGSFSCACYSGYTGNGKQCNREDPPKRQDSLCVTSQVLCALQE